MKFLLPSPKDQDPLLYFRRQLLFFIAISKLITAEWYVGRWAKNPFLLCSCSPCLPEPKGANLAWLNMLRYSAGISWSLFCLTQEGPYSRIIPLQQSRLHLRIVFFEPLRFFSCRVNPNLLVLLSLLSQLNSEHLVIRLFCTLSWK